MDRVLESGGFRRKASGWKSSERMLPTGILFRRNPKSKYVSQYEMLPHGDSVKAGRLINVFPSEMDAAISVGVSPGGIHHCCEFWQYQDLSFLPLKRGRLVPAEPLHPHRAVGSRKGHFIFKWSAFGDRRAHPVAVVLGEGDVRFYESFRGASDDLALDPGVSPIDKQLSYCAVNSPMYRSPESKFINDWPTTITRLGRANVFYI